MSHLIMQSSPPPTRVLTRLPELSDRVQSLLQGYADVQATCLALEQQIADLTAERDSLRSRLSAARARVDALLDRLSKESPGGFHE